MSRAGRPTRQAARQQAAVRAACRVAEEQRLSFDDAVVLRDLSNVIVQLRGSPVVARVATTTAEIRRGDAWLAREVAIASHLANADAPVVRPSSVIAPGPHHSQGLVLSFWEWVEELAEAPDPREAGRALRQCHEALSDFEGELPRWGAWHEAVRILDRLTQRQALEGPDLATLQRVAERLTGQLDGLALPLQAVHGDAGPANALNTSRGVVWTDWEDSFLGPSAWDLGCLVSSSRILQREPEWSELALEHYGPRIGDQELEWFVEARALQTAVWTVVIGEQHPDMRASLEARLAWLRSRDAEH